MDNDLYIAVGTRGTSFTELNSLPPPFLDGENLVPHPADKRNPLYIRSHAWVTNRRESDRFTLVRLSKGLETGIITRVAPIKWRWLASHKTEIGEAFFPKSWKPGLPQPEYVAVLGDMRLAKTVEYGGKKSKEARGEFIFPPLPSSAESSTQAGSPRNWTRDELLIALNLYHKLNFGQLDARNPVIITVAEKLGRSANSLTLKLVNLASLDPLLQLRGVKGMPNTSQLDRSVWNEFHQNLDEAVPTSEEALRTLFAAGEDTELTVSPQEGIRVRKLPNGLTEVFANAKQRRGQDYFREAVINNFGGCCGVTKLAIRELLVASHILPWGTHPEQRLNVRNGLSLSRLHDAAFDRGFISFDDSLRLLLSPRLKSELSNSAIKTNFGEYAGEELCLPSDAAPPDLSFLAEHRRVVFKKS